MEDVVSSHFQNARFVFKFLGAYELLDLAGRQPNTTFARPLAENKARYRLMIKWGLSVWFRLRDFFNRFHVNRRDGLASQRQLFEANVRDYQGRTQVNDEIQISLETEGTEDFWWLNNGVSILADNASLGGKILTIKNQIKLYNGLQT